MAIIQKLRSALFFLLKIALAGGIVWILFSRNQSAIVESFRSFDYRWLLPAIFFYFCHMAVCSERWRVLAGILNVPLNRMESLSLTMQGYFFSLVIPGGAIGGDVAKMGFVTKRAKSGTKMEGAFSVLMDRIIGMIALFVLTLLLLIPACPLLMQIDLPALNAKFSTSPELKKMLIAALALLCFAGLVASCVIFFHRLIEKLPLLGSLMHWGDRITHGMVTRMTGATDTYSKSWKQLAFLVIVSIFFVHLMTVVPLFFLLKGLHAEFSYFSVIVAVTIGNIAGLIPIFPSGIGGRDITTVTLLVAGGLSVGDAKSCQLLMTGIILLANLTGGLFFIFDTGKKGAGK